MLNRFIGVIMHFKSYLTSAVIILVAATAAAAQGQTQKSPSEVVREFYKAMREHRFKDAWSMSIYKPAVEGLSVESMEDLRPFFESQAAGVPEQIQIDSEKITGASAQVFVRLPPTYSTPQVT